MIRCRVARRRIQAALDRELSLEERFELDEHESACAECAREERSTQALQELLEGPGDPPAAAVDVGAAARAVFAALDGGAGRARKPRGARRVTVVVLALAGVAALLLLARSPVRPRPTTRAAQTVGAVEASLPGASPGAPEASPGASSGASADRAAWTAARVELAVRGALLVAFSDAAVPEEAAREHFLEVLREPARSGFSVRRFVEGLLANPDLEVARRAARCLGALGEPGSAPALERALARPELSASLLDALSRLGEPAIPALEHALARPGLAHGALGGLCRIGGERAALAIERCIRSSGPHSDPSIAALLDALTSTGAPAVGALLGLASEPPQGAEPAAILARLPLVAGAGSELVRCLRTGRIPSAVAYPALVSLQPSEGLAWLEERCAERKERALALEAIASYAGEAPLEAALRMDGGGRLPREDVLGLLARLLERDPECAERFTRGLVARNEPAAAGAWLALLLGSERPEAARSLAHLAFSPALSGDDRLWAALAVGELGGPQDGALLAELSRQDAARDRRFTAACLLAIHGLSGTPGVERVLSACSPANLRRVLAALEGEGRAGDVVRLHRVARELDGALSELEDEREPKEIL